MNIHFPAFCCLRSAGSNTVVHLLRGVSILHAFYTGTKTVISKDWVDRLCPGNGWIYLFFIVYASTVIRINFLSLIFNIFAKIWKSPIFLWCQKRTIIHKLTSWPGYGTPGLKLIIVPERQLNFLQDDIFVN